MDYLKRFLRFVFPNDMECLNVKVSILKDGVSLYVRIKGNKIQVHKKYECGFSRSRSHEQNVDDLKSCILRRSVLYRFDCNSRKQYRRVKRLFKRTRTNVMKKIDSQIYNNRFYNGLKVLFLLLFMGVVNFIVFRIKLKESFYLLVTARNKSMACSSKRRH